MLRTPRRRHRSSMVFAACAQILLHSPVPAACRRVSAGSGRHGAPTGDPILRTLRRQHRSNMVSAARVQILLHPLVLEATSSSVHDIDGIGQASGSVKHGVRSVRAKCLLHSLVPAGDPILRTLRRQHRSNMVFTARVHKHGVRSVSANFYCTCSLRRETQSCGRCVDSTGQTWCSQRACTSMVFAA